MSGDVVTSLLGHSTPTITYQHYTAIDVDAKRIAFDLLPIPVDQAMLKQVAK